MEKARSSQKREEEGQALPQRENGKARLGQKERRGPGPIKRKGRRKPGSAQKERR